MHCNLQLSTQEEFCVTDNYYSSLSTLTKTLNYYSSLSPVTKNNPTHFNMRNTARKHFLGTRCSRAFIFILALQTIKPCEKDRPRSSIFSPNPADLPSKIALPSFLLLFLGLHHAQAKEQGEWPSTMPFFLLSIS